MKLFIKQRLFTMKERFEIIDDKQEMVYMAEADFFTLGKKLRVFDRAEQEVIFIEQELWSFLPHYKVSYKGTPFAEVKARFSFRPKYEIIGPGWEVEGNMTAHEYRVLSGEKAIATISKQWFSWSDYYGIDVYAEEDVLPVLAIVLAIDAATDTN